MRLARVHFARRVFGCVAQSGSGEAVNTRAFKSSAIFEPALLVQLENASHEALWGVQSKYGVASLLLPLSSWLKICKSYPAGLRALSVDKACAV